jgi:hypothetical protein
MSYLEAARAIWAGCDPPEARELEGPCTLSTQSPLSPDPPWPPRPLELSRWPVAWRAKWGLLANELEGQGVPFPECERRAFERVKAEIGVHQRRHP